jgi:hypothetical protein
MRPRQERTGPPATERPARSGTATSTSSLPHRGDGHCLRCSCRCRCHRPPSDPLYIVAPPRPGEPFYSAYLAELRVA